MKYSESLKKNRDFQHVYRNGTSKANRYLVMYVLENQHMKNRLGISVSKKVGNSVVRHRITRLIRECYRLNEDLFKHIQGIGEDGMAPLGVVVLVERGEIVDTVVFHRTKFGEAVGDDAWHLAILKSFSQQFFFVHVLLGIKLIIDYLNNVENGKMLHRK